MQHIETLEVGDMVLAFDLDANEVAAKAVTRLHQGRTKAWIHIELDTGAAITATKSHPFWVEEQETWLEAVDLEAGMTLRTVDRTARTVATVNVEFLDSYEPTFNLEAEDARNFFAGLE